MRAADGVAIGGIPGNFDRHAWRLVHGVPGNGILTAADFRSLALSFPKALEAAHMDHPDFRVGGRIFASLGYPQDGYGMVKLTSEQQSIFVRAQPAAFEPAKGAWGNAGATMVRLRLVRKGLAREALAAAWSNLAPKALVRSLRQTP